MSDASRFVTRGDDPYGLVIEMGEVVNKTTEAEQTSRHEPQGKEEVSASPKIVETGNKIKEDIDKLTDDIDDLLEANAEEFVWSYVQRSGE